MGGFAEDLRDLGGEGDGDGAGAGAVAFAASSRTVPRVRRFGAGAGDGAGSACCCLRLARVMLVSTSRLADDACRGHRRRQHGLLVYCSEGMRIP